MWVPRSVEALPICVQICASISARGLFPTMFVGFFVSSQPFSQQPIHSLYRPFHSISPCICPLRPALLANYPPSKPSSPHELYFASSSTTTKTQPLITTHYEYAVQDIFDFQLGLPGICTIILIWKRTTFSSNFVIWWDHRVIVTALPYIISELTHCIQFKFFYHILEHSQQVGFWFVFNLFLLHV